VKLLFDENLSPRLVDLLSDLFPESAHVHQLGLGAAEDTEIWTHAKAHGFPIVSKDSDFAERSVLESGPPKIIWLRLGNCVTRDIERLLRSHADVIKHFLIEAPETCLILGADR
jgi:predicted nuclease of predicted toxin-antitoxin system